MKRDREREEAVFGLLINPLPSAARANLLADQAFCQKLGVRPKFWFPLDKDVAIETHSLNNALRGAVSGRKSAMVALRNGKRLRAKLGLRGAGEATIELRKKGFAFPDADLLSPDASTRNGALERVLERKPLAAEEERTWREISQRRALTDREYMDLMTTLGATPEALRNQLQKPQNLSVDELMPDEPAYYNRLIAPVRESKDLAGFIQNELADARAALYASHPKQALRRIGFSALWQPLIPFDLLASMTVSDVSALHEADDPFSLLFGFELCARLLPRDAGFAGPGTSFLEKLLVDPARSAARCTVFSALALITTVHVRAAAKAADALLYWTRLAALAHAGVLTDALRGMPDSEGFLQWASENFLPAYIWHGVIDRRDAPRWNPDWISPDHLYAELVGRAHGALEMVPAAERPGQWTSAMDTAFVRLKEEGRILAAFFPGPFDDFRAPVPSTANKAFTEIEERLDAAARLSDVAGLFALANSVQLTSRAVANVQRLLELPVTEPIAAGQPEMPFLRICAHIAAASRSETIGQALINRCIFKARNQGSGDAVTDLFEVIAEACGAWGDPQRHREVLGRSATNLCFAVDAAGDLSHLVAIFDVLAKRDERLMPVLARPRAIARAKLGRS